ncbi:MetQ/NlpA family ABC transporter substrate-binding protein [Tissierella sp. Yu-01]|uniref:MetQ/NlpA family ABC transporter substrate-binding protein n=1 Tax=Tissierella sp. Yu-01 TaxID=3035694 RepID=UPI00240E73F7|nr:MetQ/NlpA family ABC transporter substrate-binding protein [Tissierella sp. Yu-01]WFA09115.1 MetQ/NlpA family ABC transporter substrate-binding protein [Tissierella sp. Yu-01]
MKKILSLILIAILSLSLLAGCAPKDKAPVESSAEAPVELEEIVIGVSPEPHSKLVSLISDNLEEEGIKVKLIEFTDYVKPNHALADGELDANFFQHKPYLDDFIAQENLDLISIGGVHVEPMALYVNGLESIDDIPEGAEIAIPNDTVNGGRALLLLQENGLIKLKDGVGLAATENDVVENPKNIKFTALEAATLPRVLGEIDGAVINGNYALEAGLNPVEDGVVIEGKESPYANIVAVRAGEENEEKFVKLMEALQSDEIRAYIEENYDGGVVPAF